MGSQLQDFYSVCVYFSPPGRPEVELEKDAGYYNENGES